MGSKVPLKPNWNHIKTKLKEKYPQLSEQDLTYNEGQEEQLLARLQAKTHRTRREIEQEIENLLHMTTTR